MADLVVPPFLQRFLDTAPLGQVALVQQNAAPDWRITVEEWPVELPGWVWVDGRQDWYEAQ